MTDSQDPARLDGWNLRWLEEQKRLAALLAEIGGVLDEDHVAARLAAAGVRVERVTFAESQEFYNAGYAAGVRVGIDPDRLARALRRMVGGGADAIEGPFDVGWLTYSGEATFDDLAAAIVKAYEEEG